MEIQNLSTQLEENFAALSVKYGDLEVALTQKLAALEKVDKAMKNNLKKAEATVAKINATKATKKDQQAAIAKIDKALNPIRQELKAHQIRDNRTAGPGQRSKAAAIHAFCKYR